MGIKFLEFIGGENAVMIKSKEAFMVFVRMLANHGVEEVLSWRKPERLTYEYWTKMAELNGDNPSVMLFEYSYAKGISVSYDVKKVTEWYGNDPLVLEEKDAETHLSEMFKAALYELTESVDEEYQVELPELLGLTVTDMDIYGLTFTDVTEEYEEEADEDYEVYYPKIRIETELSEDNSLYNYQIFFDDTPVGMGSISNEGEPQEQVVEKIRTLSKIDEIADRMYEERRAE